jgi:hypothetical protein
VVGTRDLVVAREVRAELKWRGMAREYEPVLAEEVSMPGRRVGTGPRHYDRLGDEETTLTARMAIRLPTALGDQLVRACYWTAAPAVNALREWQTRWGDGPEVIMRDAQLRGAVTVLKIFCAAMAPRPHADSILEKAKLQAQVVTTSDIFRAAVKRAILRPRRLRRPLHSVVGRLVAHVLQIESTQERLPAHIDVLAGHPGLGGPQPHRLGVAVAGQVVDLEADQHAFDDGEFATMVDPGRADGEPGVDAVPGHRPRGTVAVGDLHGRRVWRAPGVRPGEAELLTVLRGRPPCGGEIQGRVRGLRMTRSERSRPSTSTGRP